MPIFLCLMLLSMKILLIFLINQKNKMENQNAFYPTNTPVRTWVNRTVCLVCSFILTATVQIHWAISICVHLSRLLLRLWISIWTKLRYQNSSENKEWLATDKATGFNLDNNKYHTQCLITFGSEIWYFNHEATLLKARKESWYLRR